MSHSIAPNTAFRVLHQAYKIFPDSAAARGAHAGETVSRQQKTLARVLKGVHWQSLFWATHTVGWRYECAARDGQ